MPALQFPGSPTHLDTYTDPNQAVWQYDSDNTVWDLITSTTRKVFSGVKAKTAANFDLTASYQDVPFDTIEFNVDNYYQTVNTKGIAPSTGFYRVLVSVFSDTQGTGASYSAAVYKNDTLKLGEINFGANQNVNFDETISLVEGDFINVKAKESTGLGALTTQSNFTMYRIGYAPGTGISNHSAFSGVRAIVTQNVNTTSTPTSITWGNTDFNANSNVLGDLYWYNSEATRLTPKTSGYYKVRSLVETTYAGSANSYTITLRKTNPQLVSTTLTTINMSPNDQIELDETIYLDADNYVDLLVSNSDNTGAILSTVYLELVREGV